MTDVYALPNPLPELQPGETNSAYRRRVIPDWYERDHLETGRNNYPRKLIRKAMEDDPSLDEDDRRAIRKEANEEWSGLYPEGSRRLFYLRTVQPYVAFHDSTPVLMPPPDGPRVT